MSVSGDRTDERQLRSHRLAKWNRTDYWKDDRTDRALGSHRRTTVALAPTGEVESHRLL